MNYVGNALVYTELNMFFCFAFSVSLIVSLFCCCCFLLFLCFFVSFRGNGVKHIEREASTHWGSSYTYRERGGWYTGDSGTLSHTGIFLYTVGVELIYVGERGLSTRGREGALRHKMRLASGTFPVKMKDSSSKKNVIFICANFLVLKLVLTK